MASEFIHYTQGLPPVPRTSMPGYDSGVLTVVIVMLLVVTFSLRHYQRFFRAMCQDLLTVRLRSNAFDDHTLNETRIIGALNLQCCVSEAILLAALAAKSCGVMVSSISTEVLLLMTLLTAGYILVQYAVYWGIGYVFTSPHLCRQWLRGFSAVQSILGIVIIVPALVTLFYPSFAAEMLVVGAVAYVLSRIVFICKGFRIFFHNLFSLVYFILYLCSVEIIPLLLIYSSSLSLLRKQLVY